MAVRDRIRKWTPGLRTREARDPMPHVRAATYALYSGLGVGGLSGQRVVPSLDHPSSSSMLASETAASNPMLFAPVWRIAFRLGALPIKCYDIEQPRASDQQEGRPPRQEDSNHGAAQLMRKPNPDLTRNLLISGTVASMYYNSRAGWYKERRNQLAPPGPQNPIVALWPIPGDVLFPISTPQRILDHFELRVLWDSPVTLPARDVCFFRLMPDPNDWTASTSPVGPLGDTMDFSTSALSAMTRLFRNAMLSRLWINLHGLDLEPEQVERLRTEMEIAASNPYGIPLMESGATIESMGEGPSTELLEASTRLTKQIVDMTFGLPTDPDNTAMFYSEVIQPVADAIEQELERSLMPEYEQPAFLEFQFRELLAGAPAERAKMHQTLILSGQETLNEARSAENRGPLPGGDDLFIPLNLIPVGSDRPAAQTKDTQGGIGGSEGKGTTVNVSPRSQPLVKAAAEAPEDPNRIVNGRWRSARDKTVHGQGEALARRLRGALKDEAAALTRSPDAAILQQTDAQIAQTLRVFMSQAAEAGAQLATELVSDPTETRTVGLSDGIVGAINTRVAEMTSQFSERRAAKLEQTTDLSGDWKVLTRHLVDVIGATETAWAFERGAADAWANAGVGDLVVVRGSHECQHGICTDVVLAGSIRPGDVPTPLHPGCKCMVLPAALVG